MTWFAILMLLTALIPAAIYPTAVQAVPPAPEQVSAWLNAGELKPLTEGALTFIQITDAHLPRQGGPGFEGLAETLQEIVGLYPDAAFVVFSGDNTERYQGRNKTSFDAILRNSPVPAYAMSGNVDILTVQYPPGPEGTYMLREPVGPPLEKVSREDYLQPVWTGQDRLADVFSVLDPGNSRRPTWYRVDKGDNLFLFLNTTDAAHEGLVRADQLAWIHEQLSGSADKNVFLFSHHGEDYLLNHPDFYSLLQYHRPRFRQVVHSIGHHHPMSVAVREGIHVWRAGYFHQAEYRVVHIRKDCIITYLLRSAAAERRIGEALKPFINLPPTVITTSPNGVRPVPPAEGPWGARRVWAANEEPRPGDMLKVVFDGGSGDVPEHRIIDQSPCANNVYINFPGKSRVLHEGLAAVACGFGGASAMVATDTYTLNHPVVANALTVEAVLSLPEAAPGFDYHVIDKKSWRMGLSADGRANFMVCLRSGEGTRRVEVSTPSPLELRSWHRITATYDGDKGLIRLFLDGREAARVETGPGPAMAAFKGPLFLNTEVPQPRLKDAETMKSLNKLFKPYLLHSVRVADRAEASVEGKPQ